MFHRALGFMTVFTYPDAVRRFHQPTHYVKQSRLTAAACPTNETSSPEEIRRLMFSNTWEVDNENL